MIVNFKKFNSINEKLLVPNKSKELNRKYDNVYILAGGAGSGKDFVLNTMLGIEGKVFDVDAIKENILKLVKNGKLKELAKEFALETGRYMFSLKTSNQYDVSLLHNFIKEKGLDNKPILSFLMSQKPLKIKSNVIFNVTLKDIDKLKEISDMVTEAGYAKENIHIIWILNSIETALINNANRTRRVDDEILLKTHKGAAMTIKEILSQNEKYRKYADGEIWLMANKAEVDNIVEPYQTKTGTVFANKKEKQHYNVKHFIAVQLKAKNKASMKPDEIDAIIVDKIKEYISSDVEW